VTLSAPSPKSDNAPRMTQAQLLPSYDKPDWESLAEEIHCPLCGYNLRGLSEPLCPECGYRFHWPDLLDPTRRLHPYLFEHHPAHSIRSFFATVTRKFRPFTFWKSLRPDQPANLRRLIIYGLIVAVVAMLPAVEVWVLAMQRWFWNSYAPFRTAWNDSIVRGMTWGSIVVATWPLLDFLLLLIFRQSMRRAKVLPEHVARCAIYSGDITFWCGLWTVGVMLWFFLAGVPYRQAWVLMLLLACGYVATALVHFARLVSAYRHYLRFHAPFATILAIHVIAVLFWITFLLVTATA
jgi:hypothetical protein